jgi:hypothetical protein
MPGTPRALATDAGRERLIALLREHFAQGRLDAGDLDQRVEMVLAAEFAAAAAAAVADLPTLVPGTGAAGGPAGPGQPKQRRGAHGHASRPGAAWVPTQERFRDPTTRAVMRVWIDPADQSRHYVPEPES